MAKFLLPYGSSRYVRLLLKQTDAGKHAHSMSDHVVSAKGARTRVLRRNRTEQTAASGKR